MKYQHYTLELYGKLIELFHDTRHNIYFPLYIIILFYGYYNLNSLFFTIIIIVMFIHLVYTNNKREIHESGIENKKRKIYPELNTNEKEIIDLLYFSREFYYYNPTVYSKMIHKINTFYHLYYSCQIIDKQLKQHYDNLIDLRKEILNILHSIIYSLHSDKNQINKLNKVIDELNTILTKKILIVKNKNNNLFKNNINKDESPINDLYTGYDKMDDLSYEIYT